MIIRDVINKLHNVGIEYNQLLMIGGGRYQLIIYNLDDECFVLNKLNRIADNVINYSLKAGTGKETHIFFNAV